MKINLSEHQLRMIITCMNLIEEGAGLSKDAKRLRNKLIAASLSAHVEEQNRIEIVKIKDLKLPKSNNKPSNELIISLDDIGQTNPIIINKDNVIIDGQLRVQALIALGKKTVIALRQS